MIPVYLAALAGVAVPPVEAWCASPLQSVMRDAARPADASGRVTLAGARGQRVTAQVVLRATGPGVRVTGVRCAPFQRDGGGRIARPEFRWAFVDYFHVEKNSTATPPEELLARAPVDIPDALSEDREAALEEGRNRLVWLQVRIPERTPAGEYASEITVETGGGAIALPVRLTVYGFGFPRRPRLAVTIWVNTDSLAKHQKVEPNTEPYWQMVRRTAKLMREHHQNTILTSWGMVQATREAGGPIRFDYTAFDRWIQTFLAEGFERIEISHMGGREHGQWEDRTFAASELACRDTASGKTENLPMEQWLPALEEHLHARGWLSRSMLHVADEPIPVNVASWRELSARVRRSAPRLRRVDAVHVPGLDGALEVWVPQLNYLEEWYAGFQEAQRKGVELWYYTAWVPQGHSPNRLLDYALIKTRMLHWFNYMSGTTGYLHWGYNFWDVPFYQFAPGDNYIVYPGKDVPRSSLRYEAMREGIEDHEYLCLLEDAVRAAARRLGEPAFDARGWTLRYLHLVARGFTDYTRDPAQMLAARDAVARAIEALGGRCAAVATARPDGAEVMVEGRTAPGARVACGGREAAAGADGRFALRVPGGSRTVAVTVRRGAEAAVLPAPVE